MIFVPGRERDKGAAVGNAREGMPGSRLGKCKRPCGRWEKLGVFGKHGDEQGQSWVREGYVEHQVGCGKEHEF